MSALGDPADKVLTWPTAEQHGSGEAPAEETPMCKKPMTASEFLDKAEKTRSDQNRCGSRALSAYLKNNPVEPIPGHRLKSRINQLALCAVEIRTVQSIFGIKHRERHEPSVGCVFSISETEPEFSFDYDGVASTDFFYDVGDAVDALVAVRQEDLRRLAADQKGTS